MDRRKPDHGKLRGKRCLRETTNMCSCDRRSSTVDRTAQICHPPQILRAFQVFRREIAEAATILPVKMRSPTE